MPEQRMVGARVTIDWQQQIQETLALAELKSSQVVLKAIAQNLGRTDPSSIPGDLAAISDRVTVLSERRACLGRLVG